MYFIELGVVEIVTIAPNYLAQARAALQQQGEPPVAGSHSNHSNSNHGGGSKVPLDLWGSQQLQEPPVKRVNKVSAGGAFGEADFFLGRCHRWEDLNSTSHHHHHHHAMIVCGPMRCPTAPAGCWTDTATPPWRCSFIYPTITHPALTHCLAQVAHPRLCMLLQHTLLKSLAIAATCSMYALHPSTAYSESGRGL